MADLEATPSIVDHSSSREKDDSLALYCFIIHLLGIESQRSSSAARVRGTMRHVTDSDVGLDESSRQITPDSINTFAGRTPYTVSRGFVQAKIGMVNPGAIVMF
jgi:hypothetical protein